MDHSLVEFLSGLMTTCNCLEEEFDTSPQFVGQVMMGLKLLLKSSSRRCQWAEVGRLPQHRRANVFRRETLIFLLKFINLKFECPQFCLAVDEKP